MITSLRLRNFKGYRDSGALEWKPLTLLVGPNNAGKSSLLHALLLLRQTTQERETTETLITSGPLIDLGSFHEILRGGRAAEERKIGIALTIDEELAESMSLRPSAREEKTDEAIPRSLLLTFGFDYAVDKIYLSRFRSLSGLNRPIAEVRRSGSGYWAPTLSREARAAVRIQLDRIFPYLVFARASYSHTTRAFDEYNVLWHATHVWSRVLEKIRYIGPIRSPVPRYNLRGRTGSFLPGSGGEQLQRLMRSGASGVDAESRLIKEVDRWVSDHFKFLSRLRTVAIDKEGIIRSLVGDEVAGYEGINVANMGEGLSQALPIVAEAVSARRGEILLVEQPEIHLHPRAQADLADLFVDRVREGSGVQCVVETHSEHLLLRVRRRIAEGVISPEEVTVFYVDKADGDSRVQEMKLNRKGFFASWPEGFFEEGFEEAVHLSEAAAKVS